MYICISVWKSLTTTGYRTQRTDTPGIIYTNAIYRFNVVILIMAMWLPLLVSVAAIEPNDMNQCLIKKKTLFKEMQINTRTSVPAFKWENHKNRFH